jgi:large subunit ribosomal protein L25
MKKVQLSGSARTNVGKKDAKAIRVAGMVPCVLYGNGEQSHFSVKQVDLQKIVLSPDVYQVELVVEGKKTMGIIQDMQQHPVKGTLEHVDFLELSDKKEVKVGLPVRLTGASRGVLNGGKLMQVFRRLNIKGLPADLPEAITVDISELRIGQSTRVKEIAALNSKLTFLDPANAVVVSVSRARGSVDDDVEAAAEGQATEEAAAE